MKNTVIKIANLAVCKYQQLKIISKKLDLERENEGIEKKINAISLN